MKKFILGAICALSVSVAIAAHAGGFLTNGLPLILGGTLNGVAQTPYSGAFTNVTPMGPLVPMDTSMASGLQPQSVAATPFQVAATSAAELIKNQATSTVHAATLNTRGGLLTTEALTTAAGATYTFTLTNSLLVAGAAAPSIQVASGTDTAARWQVTSVTNAVGSTVIVLTNLATTAANGTILIAFHI